MAVAINVQITHLLLVITYSSAVQGSSGTEPAGFCFGKGPNITVHSAQINTLYIIHKLQANYVIQL